jgi:hypothetical protein
MRRILRKIAEGDCYSNFSDTSTLLNPQKLWMKSKTVEFNF